MLDLVRGGHPLQPGVLQNPLGHESLVQGDVDVFVDGRGDEETRVFLVIAGEVRAAAAEGNAKG